MFEETTELSFEGTGEALDISEAISLNVEREVPPKKTKKPKKKPEFRSKFEKRIARQLKKAGAKFTYERTVIPYIRNGKVAHYHPDFHVNRQFFLEGKGYFVGGARDRLKLILVKQQHPDLDLRLVFQDEKLLAAPGMTYAHWADTMGIPWSGGGKVPLEWLQAPEEGTEPIPKVSMQ
jgi:hypothetical protein